MKITYYSDLNFDILVSILFNAAIVLVVLDYILQRIFNYKKLRMFEKMLLDNNKGTQQSIIDITQTCTIFEEKLTERNKYLDECFANLKNLFESHKKDTMYIIKYFGEYIDSVLPQNKFQNHDWLSSLEEKLLIIITSEINKLEGYIKHLDNNIHIDFQAITRRCEDNFIRIIDLEEEIKKYYERIDTKYNKVNLDIVNLVECQSYLSDDIEHTKKLFSTLQEILFELKDDYYHHKNMSIKTDQDIVENYCNKNGSRILSLEKFVFGNVVLESNLIEQFVSFEDRMTDKFCKIAEKINISDNLIGDFYCCLESIRVSHDQFLEGAEKNICYRLTNAMKVCFPNFNFNKYAQENLKRIKEVMK